MLIEAGRSTDGGRHLRFSKSDAAMMAPDVLILLNVRGTYWGFASARAPSCTDRRLPSVLLAQARPVLEDVEADAIRRAAFIRASGHRRPPRLFSLSLGDQLHDPSDQQNDERAEHRQHGDLRPVRGIRAQPVIEAVREGHSGADQ
jgi:hypothetical protein